MVKEVEFCLKWLIWAFFGKIYPSRLNFTDPFEKN